MKVKLLMKVIVTLLKKLHQRCFLGCFEIAAPKFLENIQKNVCSGVPL